MPEKNKMRKQFVINESPFNEKSFIEVYLLPFIE